MRSRSLCRAFLITSLLAAAACDSGGDSGPTAPGPTLPSPATAGFKIAGIGQDQTASYTSGSNTVLCTRNAGWASLFLRFGEQAGGNGEGAAHLDLDLCNHTGGGAFGPKDPELPACGGAKTFDIWWHSADGAVFNNEATAADCALQVTQNGSQLAGTFHCTGLTEVGANRTVDVLDGTFACTEV